MLNLFLSDQQRERKREKGKRKRENEIIFEEDSLHMQISLGQSVSELATLVPGQRGAAFDDVFCRNLCVTSF